MDGLTPWEIATLKVVFHRIDEGNKGYLNRRNFDTICNECDLNLTPAQVDELYRRIDKDGDGRVIFGDFLDYLSAVSFEAEAPKTSSVPATTKRAITTDGDGGLIEVAAEHPITVTALALEALTNSSVSLLTVGPSTTVANAAKGFSQSAQAVSQALTAPTTLTTAADTDAALFMRTAARIRQSYASDLSAIFAGGILGLLPLLKSKFFIVAGTLFYDPIRLFRDNIVDYTGSLENDNRSAKRTASAYQFIRNPHVGWFTKLQMSFVLCRGLLGVLGWVVFAATLDCLGGVVMFLTYSRIRCRLVTNEDSASWLAGRRYLLEGCAGFVGGAAGGLVERPLRYVAHHRILNPSRLITPMAMSDAFKGSTWAVYRQAVSHSVFFSAFAFSHEFQRWLWYRKLKYERTSWRDACITAVAGCSAGGSYRLISLPMLNIYHETNGALRPWSLQPRSVEFAHLHGNQPSRIIRSAYQGLGYSMLWIMPITGAAFLVYERLLVNL